MDKEVIMFDLDGTLTESKSAVDKEMVDLFCELLDKKKVVVIGGGNYPQFRDQFLDHLECEGGRMDGLLIFPTSGAKLYEFQSGEWKKVYEKTLDEGGKKKIRKSFEKAFDDIDYQHPEKTYGEIIEDRGTQMTFSALGQEAPLSKKEEWNRTSDVRKDLQEHLVEYLPEFEVRIGGTTSIDITQKGVDKAYGVRQTMERFGVGAEDILYVGDALQEGGNDEAVKKTGIDTYQVEDIEDTKECIRNLLG